MKGGVFVFASLQILIAIVSASSSSSSSESKEKVEYTYTLWIGDNVNQTFSIKLESEVGIFFIGAMNQAAAEDNNFQFLFTQYSIGKFITSIGGFLNNPATYEI